MRRIELNVSGCDSCPLRRYDGDYRMSHDSGWDCGHPDGGFRIADEGGYDWIQKFGDSVEKRMGKSFPDGCPLENLSSPNVSRSIADFQEYSDDLFNRCVAAGADPAAVAGWPDFARRRFLDER